MTDIYIKSKNETAIRDVCTNFKHVIGPVRGSAATVDENSGPIPARGDLNYWYTCIRSDTAIELPSGIEPCSVEEGSSVVGVWA